MSNGEPPRKEPMSEPVQAPDRTVNDAELDPVSNEVRHCWFDELTSPGLYVDSRRGLLFRVSDGLGIHRERSVVPATTATLIKLSDDPFLSLTKARRIAAARGLRIRC